MKSSASPTTASVSTGIGGHSVSAVRRAFTLLELLVVIAILALLAALLLPTLSAAKRRSLAVACTSNLKQFGAAFQLYTTDHNDRLLPNKGGQGVPLGETWVEGWLGIPGPDCTNTLYLKRSLLWPYLNAIEVWRCPIRQDPNVIGVTMPRVREIAMNHFMGAPWNDPRAESYHKLSDITRPSPSDALVFIEERIDTINDGAFAVQLDFDENQPDVWMLLDKPGIVHKKGCNLAFADGHAGLHHWQDPRTISVSRDDATLPGDADVLWLQRHCTAR